MNWAHRIPFRSDLERDKRREIFIWLGENLGKRDFAENQSTWRWDAEGGKAKDNCDWFCFRHKTDAMLFKLVWNDILNPVD